MQGLSQIKTAVFFATVLGVFSLEFIYIHVLFRTLFTSVRPSVCLTRLSYA